TFFIQSRLWYDVVLLLALVISFLYIGFLVLPFTPLGKKMIQRSTEKNKKALNLLVANVYQYNTDYEKLLKLIADRDPDIVFLLETDAIWQKNVVSIKEKYPFAIEIPQENTYGLLFYSRLEITKQEINYH